jgi:cytochrome P450
MADVKAVVDFDHFSPDYARNWRKIDRQLRERTPVAWSCAHGGFWILSTYEDCRSAAFDWKTFSSENDIAGTGNGGKGILIPRNPYQFALSESDPPQSTTIRKLEFPFFQANNIAKWDQIAKRYTDEAIDAVAERGTIDFALELAMTVPAKTTLQLAGVPLADWEVFAMSAHDMSHMVNTDPKYPHDKIAFVQRLILELVRTRRADPRDDIVSALTQGSLNGRPLADEMVVGVLSAVVFGGFDTTATSILNLLLFLNDKPELRARLRADRAALNAAIEEILRLHPPGHALGRTVMKDVEIKGQSLKAGERVLLVWSAANRDPAIFERPDEFWLERPNAAQHLTFSFGPHRCLGSLLAKMEIRTVLESVLQRLGDFRINLEQVERYETIGHIDGFKRMPAEFTPERKARIPAANAAGQGRRAQA